MISNFQRPLLILLFVLFLAGCGANDEPFEVELPTLPPPPTPVAEESVAEVDFEVAQEESFETVEVTENGSSSEVYGELNLEYPPTFGVGESDSVVVNIKKLDVAVTPSEIYVEVSTETDDATTVGPNGKNIHTVNIYLADSVRVELTSDSFNITSRSGISTKSVDLEDSSKEQVWVWEVTAPNEANDYKLFVEVYLANNPSASWVRDIPVEVIDSFETAPTPVTPEPPAESSAYGILLASVLVLLALLGVGAIAYFGYFKDKNAQIVDPDPTDGERTPAEILNAKYRYELTNAIEAGFNLAELKDLCYDIDINIENFEGGFVEKTQQVVAHCIRRSRLQDLIDYLSENRPDIDLPKHPLTKVLENQMGRAELRDLCKHLNIDIENIEDGSDEMIQAIMVQLTKTDPLQDLIDYLAKNHPDIDLKQEI